MRSALPLLVLLAVFFPSVSSTLAEPAETAEEAGSRVDFSGLEAVAAQASRLAREGGCELPAGAGPVPEEGRAQCLRTIVEIREILGEARVGGGRIEDRWIREIGREIRGTASAGVARDAWSRLSGGLDSLEEEAREAAAREAEEGAGGARAAHLDEARGKLEKILSRREFAQGAGANSFREILDAMFGRFWSWVAGLLERFLPAGIAAGLAHWSRYGLGACLVVALLALTIWLIRKAWLMAEETRETRTGFIPISAAGGRTAEELLRESSACEEAGKYREALRWLYVASLVRLAEGGILGRAGERFRTNWEIVDAVSRLRPPDFPLAVLSDMTGRFDVVWYGNSPCSQRDLLEFGEMASRVTAAAHASGVGGRARSTVVEDTGS